MAIGALDSRYWQALRDSGQLPPNPRVFELGQANWYGDRDAACLPSLVREYADPAEVPHLLGRLAEPGTPDEPRLFILAEVFYRATLRPVFMEAIDYHGTPRAKRHDLNGPIPYGDYCEVLINSGTAEHIFNQAQFFATCHDATVSGGLMVHFLPYTGWVDHGFYTYSPTFVVDLGAANGYELVSWWLTDWTAGRYSVIAGPEVKPDLVEARRLGRTMASTMHAVTYRKTGSAPFRFPQQGYYSRPEISPAARADWQGRI